MRYTFNKCQDDKRDTDLENTPTSLRATKMPLIVAQSVSTHHLSTQAHVVSTCAFTLTTAVMVSRKALTFHCFLSSCDQNKTTFFPGLLSNQSASLLSTRETHPRASLKLLFQTSKHMIQKPEKDMNIASGFPKFARQSVLNDESFTLGNMIFINCQVDLAGLAAQ